MIEAHRTSPLEISLTMEPYDARVIAHALRQTAEDWFKQDARAREWARKLEHTAHELMRAVERETIRK